MINSVLEELRACIINNRIKKKKKNVCFKYTNRVLKLIFRMNIHNINNELFFFRPTV